MLRVFAATHRGHVRSRNEDYYGTSASDAEAIAPWAGTISPDEGWALVADGMGGHAAGEVASLLSAKCLSIMMPELLSEQAVTDAIVATNAALHEAMRQQPGLAGMGTTIAGLRFLGKRAMCFNIGDSRIYVSEGGVLRQISVDHVVEGYILTQCLGGSRPIALAPFISIIPVRPSTRFLLCTDGLTDMVTDDQISACLSSADPVVSLIDAALNAGGIDNVTVVVIEIV